jgi:carotenoid 1,2-hydratase
MMRSRSRSSAPPSVSDSNPTLPMIRKQRAVPVEAAPTLLIDSASSLPPMRARKSSSAVPSPWAKGTQARSKRPSIGHAMGTGIPFDAPIAENGYRWFRIACVSDDAEHVLVIMAMLGNPFSPAYRKARALAVRSGSGPVNPLSFSTMNIALSGAHTFWGMNEIDAVKRSAFALTIGKSMMIAAADRLIVPLDEQAATGKGRLRGEVEVELGTLSSRAFDLTDEKKHSWAPIRQGARCQVRLKEPALSFVGSAFVDTNYGTEPLETSIVRWTRSEAYADAGTAWLSFESQSARGNHELNLISLDQSVERTTFAAPPLALKKSRFGLQSSVRLDEITRVTVLEDTPFYVRNLIVGRQGPHDVRVFHEHVDLTRFKAGWMQALIPLAMRRT